MTAAKYNACFLVENTSHICSCCGKNLVNDDVQLMIIRDAFENNVEPPDEFSKQCYKLVAKALDDRPIISSSAIVYFCKTCVPALPHGGPHAPAPQS